MRPAFASTKHAAAFVGLLLALLLLPALAKKSWLPGRDQSYAIQGWKNGPFPWIRQQIFEEKKDVDIVFLGSSHLLNGIDTPYVQDQLSKHLGHAGVVRSVCWGGRGFDALFFITQDLLKQRKVRLLVCDDESFDDEKLRNAQAPLWFRFSENADALAGLPLDIKAQFYMAAVIGMPRNILSLTRSNLAENFFPETNYLEKTFAAENPIERLGSISTRLNLDRGITFTNFEPPSHNPPPLIFNAQLTNLAANTHFLFTGPSVPAWQLNFAQKFAQLARERDCQIVFLHVPVLSEIRDSQIQERACWPMVLHADIPIVGVPPAEMFAGLTSVDINQLFYNSEHLNKNGMEYFTKLITPALLKLHENAHQH